MMVASMRITSGQWRARRVEERRGRRNNASVGEEHRGVDVVTIDDRAASQDATPWESGCSLL